ncbi:unnamed protein product [Spirodela intermedia]|uniref:Uncharacterized protein n=1 Tax=Spirodela intermedia TaxID=51605 RepID=A0A7I8K6T1_SPIIN|nr:unnamed protein product [Spirodela intermedia]
MATSSALLHISGGTHLESSRPAPSSKLRSLDRQKLKLISPRKMNLSNHRRDLSVRAEYGDGSRNGSGDFLAGFLLGGALFGTLAYVFAPQIRRSLLNEDEYGFRRAKRPIYYDEGLEKTRQTLNAKINQLNSAIDNVSSRLRGGGNGASEPVEADSEVEASI